jgi:hypothetical protein
MSHDFDVVTGPAAAPPPAKPDREAAPPALKPQLPRPGAADKLAHEPPSGAAK